MKVTLLLADAAQVSDGKLHILGGGWSITGPPSPSAIALLLEVPSTETNRQHNLRLELLDGGGGVVLDAHDEPVVVDAQFEVGRPAGAKPGAPIAVPMALNLAPLPLKPSAQYEWRLTIDGRSEESWRLPFRTRKF